MQNIKALVLIVSIATFYFVSVYFAVAALFPEFAFQAGLVAMVIALVIYRILRAAGMDEAGLPMGLLILTPIICLTAGVAWWLLRWLGLWGVK